MNRSHFTFSLSCFAFFFFPLDVNMIFLGRIPLTVAAIKKQTDIVRTRHGESLGKLKLCAFH